MKEFLKSTKGKVCIALAVVLVLAGLAGGWYALWLHRQPKFHDVTIELGEQMPDISEFLTEYGKKDKARLVTEASAIDLEKVGTLELTFRQGAKEETVTLTIVDTTAPEIRLKDLVLATGTVPAAEDFVEQIKDYGAVEVSFGAEFVQPETYDDMTVSILVKDASGNTTAGSATVSWLWLKEAFRLELGDTLEKADLLLDPEKDEALLDQQIIDEINTAPAGKYVIASTSGSKTVTCTITVSDAIGPEIVLKEVYVYAGGTAALEDFVESISDPSGVAEVRLMTELTFTEEGVQTVTVEAEDVYGNITSAETTLHIVTDTVAPTFSGLSDMTVKKHSSPNFKSGVSATDDRDGKLSFTYDASKVDLDTAGTYYVTYTARDSSGNVTTAKRKVTVEHDQEDTKALLASIADKLSDDPEKIRDYVRYSIRYSANESGGDDPFWYGFTVKRGNCLVFATCLKQLLDYKGYETQLIWVTAPEKYYKSHYWVLIKLEEGWRHIDATPGVHATYSLMTDEQRYKSLVKAGVNRDWDRTMWPACD